MLNDMTGPIGAFKGAMGSPCSRYANCIEIAESAIFSVLDLQFPATGTDVATAVAPTTLTYPPTMRILNVKRFQLTSGAVLVSFRK